MSILSQNRQCIINYDNMIAIQVHGQYIHCHSATQETIPIGLYKSDERACEVLEELFDFLSDNYYVSALNNVPITHEKVDIYVMPEE